MKSRAPLRETDHTSPLSYVHMFWASLAFATMGAFAHKAGEYSSWQLVAVSRSIVACIFASLIAWLGGVKFIFLGSRTLWVRSLAGSVGMMCNFYALAKLPVSDVLTLMNTTPVWVTIMLWLVFGQKPVPGVVWAVATSVIGIFLIQQPHFQGGKFACLLALSGAFCTSIAMLGLNRMRDTDPRAIVLHFSLVSSLITSAFMLLTQDAGFLSPLGSSRAVTYLFLTGAAGVIGQIGMTMAFARGHATRISIVGLSQILFGICYDVAIWNRKINLISIIGMLLIAAPTAWLLLSEPPAQSKQVVEAEMS